MIKVYNDNIKPEFTSFDRVAIGDTFAFEGSTGVYVYIKTNHASDNNYNNCICLGDSRIGASTLPRITGFSAEDPVRLIDCELHWKFRDTRECEE